MGKATVLIVAPGDDIHALSVQRRLAELSGDVSSAHIVDTRTFPASSNVTWRIGGGSYSAELRLAAPLVEFAQPVFVRERPIDATVNLSDIASVWMRRPGNVHVDDRIGVAEFRRYAGHATHAALGSVFAACPMHNRPSVEDRLRWKPLQLVFAERAGLRVPLTLVTASPQEALAFVDALAGRRAQVIYKQIVSTGDGPPTRLFSEADRERIEHVALCPTLFQERIVGGPDLRIAVIGSSVFAAEWRKAGGPAPGVDVRFEPDTGLWPVTMPQEFQAQLLRLHSLMELSIGIYDFKMDDEGTPYFLEVNPGGQWLGLEVKAGWPVSWAMARLLAPGIGAAIPPPTPFSDKDLAAMMEEFETSLQTQAG